MLTETRPRSKTDPSVVGARVNRLILTRVEAVEYTSRMTKSFDVETNRRFWTTNAKVGEYQGSENAELLLFLTQHYVGQRVLDAGAGDGTLVRTLQHATPQADVRGVDLVPKNDDVEQGDLTRLAHEAESYDAVFCSEVIEHMTPDDSRRALEELTRVLAPGGHLILTTPFEERLEDKMIHCPHCDSSFHRWGHQRSFTDADFLEIAARHRLDVVELFAIRYSRLQRFRVLGRRICGSRLFKNWMRRANGKRHLVLVARKTTAGHTGKLIAPHQRQAA